MTDEVENSPERNRRAAWVIAVGLLLVLLAALAPGILEEAEREQDRQTRVCKMAKVMAGEDPSAAELICSRAGWQR